MGEDPYPEDKTKWQLFTQYVLPWFILAAICFGLYLVLLYGFQAVVILSEPLSEWMKEIGL